ncbi:unnamed protein product [Clonostachys rosea f. rosea IK726]|uniref:Uncharacterized protein n=1 Tax=Clonostachys rosea f. rosea IK726 TaxID=1349383 RepID=A0ACA9U966_BIOOC|nr:unnamed protein product [Clonostachys rosea f. rosea IK726]
MGIVRLRIGVRLKVSSVRPDGADVEAISIPAAPRGPIRLASKYNEFSIRRLAWRIVPAVEYAAPADRSGRPRGDRLLWFRQATMMETQRLDYR